jgi:4-hydroxy-2-oxoheptanedioate aldolase
MTMASAISVEICAGSGFDWLLLDMEHSANDLTEIVDQLRAAFGGTAEPAVRIPWNDPVYVKRVLDSGARTLLFPFVQNAAEAEAAVRATRYPPRGIRGVSAVSRATRFGRVQNYHQIADQEICVLVQVETKQAVNEIEAIARVDGVDGIFVGPADLSASIGYPNNWRQPEAWQLVLEAGRRIQKAGKPAGFLSGVEADCRDVLEAGFKFVAVGTDMGILARQSEALRQKYKS